MSGKRNTEIQFLFRRWISTAGDIGCPPHQEVGQDPKCLDKTVNITVRKCVCVRERERRRERQRQKEREREREAETDRKRRIMTR